MGSPILIVSISMGKSIRIQRVNERPALLISAGEEVEEVFAEDYDDPDKDLEEEIEPIQVKSVNGIEKEKEEVEEAEDTDIRQVGGRPPDKSV